MFLTGIGRVLVGFAKYENDINRVASQNKEIKKETVSQAQEEQAQKEIPEKPVKKRGTFNIIDIITNFSNKTGFFKQDDIE